MNIVDHTPFGRDVLKELSTACQRHGIMLGLYYSQTQDWSQPNGWGNHWDFDRENVNFDQYLQATVKPHLKELLSNYGDIGLIWFDTPQVMTYDQVKSCATTCMPFSRIALFPAALATTWATMVRSAIIAARPTLWQVTAKAA